MRRLSVFAAVVTVVSMSSSGLAADGGQEAPTGKWEGHYVCHANKTGLTLTFEGTADELTARASFYPHDEGPETDSGQFKVTGKMASDDKLVLESDEWIEQPSGHVMVGFEGEIEKDGQRIRGELTGVRGCTTFSVEKVGT
ncbi:MAG: hypothetical protein ABEK29_03190, partial [Bradymonadaceae bacterium]